MNATETTLQDEDRSKALAALWTDAAIARMTVKAAGKRFDCQQIPSPLFEQLCRQALTRGANLDDVYEWLKTAISKRPARSSFYRFAAQLRREFIAASDAWLNGRS